MKERDSFEKVLVIGIDAQTKSCKKPFDNFFVQIISIWKLFDAFNQSGEI